MANKKLKNRLNIKGKWYCTDPEDEIGEGCIACGLCYGNAPEFFMEDEDGNAYVFEQPQTKSEIELCEEQLGNCPVDSIGEDG